MKWIRYGCASLIVIATLAISDQAAKFAAIQTAQQFYAEQRYVSDRDIQFSPLGLQEYSAEIVNRSTNAGRFTQAIITFFGMSGASAVLLAPDRKAWKRRFEDWQRAVKSGDNSAIAKIELEIQNDRGNL